MTGHKQNLWAEHDQSGVYLHEDSTVIFGEIQNLEAGYNEEMSEAANTYLTNLNAATGSVHPS